MTVDNKKKLTPEQEDLVAKILYREDKQRRVDEIIADVMSAMPRFSSR